MNSRKIVAILVTVAMVFGSFAVSFADDTAAAAAAASNTTFTDITDHWGAAAIEKWAGYGIISGYEGLFRPNDSITRGEMAVILDNMMDYQLASKTSFWDLQAGQFYTDAVLKANAAGIIKGYDGSVRPTDKITKEEAAVMMSRAFAVKAETSTKGFVDAAAVSDWAKDAVFGMEAKGFVSGFDGYFNPKANITRAEAVTMINNIVKAYYTTAGTYTESVDGTAVIKVADVTLKGITVTGNLIIAEGVGQGDAYLDSVTIKGDTVVRGGGENSIHITGKSSVTKITIEKVGNKIRVVVDDGINVPEVQVVAANEEIVITGTVGTVDVSASGATVYATAAEIKTANITGDNSKIVVGDKSTVDSVTVASTAKNTKIEAAAGSTVKAVTASAEVNISGKGTVTAVTLKEGADGSSITTPKTQTTVGSNVTGVTGAGDKPISAGATATNNDKGDDLTSTTNPGGGGGGGGDGGGTVTHPTLSLTNLTSDGDAITKSGDVYQVPIQLIKGASGSSISVDITGSDFVTNHVYTIYVEVKRTSPSVATKTASSTGISGILLEQHYTNSFSSLTDLLNYYDTLNDITGNPSSDFTSFLSTQQSGAEFTVTYTYKDTTNNQTGALNGGVFKFKLINLK